MALEQISLVLIWFVWHLDLSPKQTWYTWKTNTTVKFLFQKSFEHGSVQELLRRVATVTYI